jgi:hypothetical protein
MLAPLPAPSKVLWSLFVLLGLSASFLAPQISVMAVIAYCATVTLILPFVLLRHGLRGARLLVRAPRLVRLVPRDR